jgi:solute carrier family 10 (sodium/bile acid cotransporter), member 7
MKSFFTKNWFILGIVTALALGFLVPEFGVRLNTRSIFTTILIVLLFLISGFKLPTETIKEGMKDVRVHVFIQLYVFVLVPVFFYLTSLPFREVMDGKLVIGIYAMACLPTTISSCIVFTQIAGGNVVATMFNASLANVAGVIISPLILSLMIQSAGSALPLSELLGILQGLALKMLLPIAVGQIARKYAKKFAVKNGKRLGIISSVFVLMIVFVSFSKTANNPLFIENLKVLVVPFIYLAISHLVLLTGAFTGAKALRLKTENLITVLFAAPQKTLAMGVPLLGTFFAGNSEALGIVLLPLIFYHLWQLFIAGFIPRLVERLPRTQEAVG